jgi:hypothetical protein
MSGKVDNIEEKGAGRLPFLFIDTLPLIPFQQGQRKEE